MSSRVTEARLQRLASELKPPDSNVEAAARQALHQKLDVMAERLQADGPIDWATSANTPKPNKTPFTNSRIG